MIGSVLSLAWEMFFMLALVPLAISLIDFLIA